MAEEDYSDEELEALRRRRLAEMQRAAVDDQRRTQAQQQVERQKQAIIRRILTPEARQRLTNIRMVKPEFAEELEMQLIQLDQSGRLRGQVSEEQLKNTLMQLEAKAKAKAPEPLEEKDDPVLEEPEQIRPIKPEIEEKPEEIPEEKEEEVKAEEAPEAPAEAEEAEEEELEIVEEKFYDLNLRRIW